MAKPSDQSTDNEENGPADPNMSGYVSPVRDSGLNGVMTPEYDIDTPFTKKQYKLP